MIQRNGFTFDYLRMNRVPIPRLIPERNKISTIRCSTSMFSISFSHFFSLGVIQVVCCPETPITTWIVQMYPVHDHRVAASLSRQSSRRRTVKALPRPSPDTSVSAVSYPMYQDSLIVTTISTKTSWMIKDLLEWQIPGTSLTISILDPM